MWMLEEESVELGGKTMRKTLRKGLRWISAILELMNTVLGVQIRSESVE